MLMLERAKLEPKLIPSDAEREPGAYVVKGIRIAHVEIWYPEPLPFAFVTECVVIRDHAATPDQTSLGGAEDFASFIQEASELEPRGRQEESERDTRDEVAPGVRALGKYLEHMSNRARVWRVEQFSVDEPGLTALDRYLRELEPGNQTMGTG